MEPVPAILPAEWEVHISNIEAPAPPPDPLGEVDPEKSQRFLAASGANALWNTIMQGEKISKNIEGWAKVVETLTPPITKIIEYLQYIIG